ncbi:hypothetical protein GCM10010460_01100 [Microbacterium terrae]|nr:hypothetical protein GCM10017594_26920 [Microbacterium terrae]
MERAACTVSGRPRRRGDDDAAARDEAGTVVVDGHDGQRVDGERDGVELGEVGGPRDADAAVLRHRGRVRGALLRVGVELLLCGGDRVARDGCVELHLDGLRCCRHPCASVEERRGFGCNRVDSRKEGDVGADSHELAADADAVTERRDDGDHDGEVLGDLPAGGRPREREGELHQGAVELCTGRRVRGVVVDRHVDRVGGAQV